MKINTGIFPKYFEARAVKIAPKMATTCINKILTIKPNVFSFELPHDISSSPK